MIKLAGETAYVNTGEGTVRIREYTFKDLILFV